MAGLGAAQSGRWADARGGAWIGTGGRGLWHAVPAYPTASEIWLRLLETYRG